VQAKEKGEEFNKAKAEKQFTKKDKDKDGFLSKEERAKKKSE